MPSRNNVISGTQQISVGSTLRQLRLHAGLTLAQVARSAEVSIDYLSRIEIGKKQPSDKFVATVLNSIASSLVTQ